VVDYWFKDPQVNIGVICGGPSNLAIIDFDNIDFYYEWRKETIKQDNELSVVAGRTYRVRTARGMHLYVRTAARERSRKNRDHSVDIRCSNNYTLVPPSIHPSGKHYEAIGNPSDIIVVNSLSNFLPDPTVNLTVASDEVDIFHPNIGMGADELKARIPILRFVSQFSHPYRTSTDGRWWMSRCIHPKHPDRSPSFQIDAVSNRAKCLSSRCEFCQDKGMDVIDLYARMHNLNMGESIRELEMYF
jgi:hypothetical protein